jgi:hypothetical protein
MPKKDTASAVLGMLSAAGAQTRPPVAAPLPPEPAVSADPEVASPPAVTAPEPAAATLEPAGSASVSRLPSAPPQQIRAEDAAPRTLRLRPDTASRLRAAWLEAKRDDVLLTAQDFASELVEDALVRHRRRRAASSS